MAMLSIAVKYNDNYFQYNNFGREMNVQESTKRNPYLADHTNTAPERWFTWFTLLEPRSDIMY